MTKEEKQLLLKDLCGRLPYGVICNLYDVEDANKKFQLKELSNLIISAINSGCIKPYLRPMSSMTEEEVFEMSRTVFHQVNPMGVEIERDRFIFKIVDSDEHFAGHTILLFDQIYSLEQIDWLNKKMFDYRGLIEKGLALEASDGMYKTE